MPAPLRRSHLLLTAALTVGVLPLLPTTAATAAQPAERQFIVSDSNGDGHYLLSYVDGGYPEGGVPVLLEYGPEVSVGRISQSADGSRVIYTRFTSTKDGQPLAAQVVVRDLSTQLVRVLESVPGGGPLRPAVAQLSPDGTKAVWELYDENTQDVAVRESMVAAGPASTLASGGYTPYAFLSNDTVLLQDLQGNPFTEPYAGGAKTPVAGLPVDAVTVAMSPDGSHLAFGLYDTTVAEGSPAQADMQVAPVTLTDGVAAVGTPVTLETTGFNYQPAFSHDGSVVTWSRDDGLSGPGDLWRAPADGSAPAAARAVTGSDESDTAFTASPYADTVAPGVATATTPFTLSGSTATLRWGLPSDSDLSGVQIVRTQLDNNSVVTRFAPAPTTAVVDTGLLIGKTYRYEISAMDRSGNLATAATRNLTAAQAVPAFADPTSGATVRTPFPIRFMANPVRYTIDFTINGGGYRPWVRNVLGVERIFGSAASAGIAATSSVPGQTYRFRTVATDTYGNSTAAALSGKAVVPFDQTSAALSGGVNVARADAWLGTLRTLSRSTDYARIAITGDRFQVIGERCTTCGIVDIYDGSTRIAAVDTHASARQGRQVLYTRLWAAGGNHTITLRPRGTSGRPNIVLDGFAVRR